MYNILEQILPPEVAMNIMLYTQHPIAEAMTPLIVKHRGKMIKLRVLYERGQPPKQFNYDGFALNYFIDKRIMKGRTQGKTTMEVMAENRHIESLYF